VPDQLDTSKSGLDMFFKEWQIMILSYVWSVQKNGAKSGMVWDHLLGTMIKPVSRASVINFLKEMAERGVLREDKESRKGGYHGVYYSMFSESEFKRHLAEHLISKLLEEYPGEARKVVLVAK
jgi:predicted transcriptional regulator